MARLTMSTMPPAGNGTRRRIGLLGNACALAADAASHAAALPSAPMAPRRVMSVIVLRSLRRGENLGAACEIVIPGKIDIATGRSQVGAMADTAQFAPDYDAPIEYMRRTR